MFEFTLLHKFLILLFAHYLGDYPLQGDFLGVQKSNYKYLLFVHCLIWTGCVSIALAVIGGFSYTSLIFLFVVHYAIDAWKCKEGKKTPEYALTWWLWLDQAAHALQLVVVLWLTTMKG